MPRQTIQSAVSVSLEPEEVIRFVSDIRNRSKYLQTLKSVSNIEGTPGEVTRSWTWRWEWMGQEFEGTGKTVDFDPGRHYSFVTEGGIESHFTYRAEPENEGTRLSIDVDFEVPQVFVDRNDLEGLLTITRVRAQESAWNLKRVMEAAGE